MGEELCAAGGDYHAHQCTGDIDQTTVPLHAAVRNVLGSFVVMELIKQLAPLLMPIPFNCYFDIIDGLIQAYVFVFLTSLFIKEAVEE